MTRSYARAPKGQRAKVTEPYEAQAKLSVISALSLDGVGATFTIDDAVDGEVFSVYVERLLVPELRRGDIVFMDNVSFHKNRRAVNLIEAAGARAEYLPAYSPEFNPIEHGISKIKAALRRAKAKTQPKLERALSQAMRQVTSDDIRGWFNHCGYACPRK
jgi:transposase